ncbi:MULTISPECIES: phage tail assembly chaperone [unclassified Pseudomonas]|uniref:phage tail assembly chaperone n=1 Tax=unclassified Pseudomonas TaxID=196821 RepID=UPI00186820EC|nr:MULTISPECIES: phage tail assembly chaperone [unclassified Pseudomonas]
MARVKIGGGIDLRSMALDPMRNFKHEGLTIDEWEGAKVVVRALSAGDWVEYRRRAALAVAEARQDAGLPAQSAVSESEDQPPVEPRVEIQSSPLYAFVLVRALLDENNARVFQDEDVPAVAEAFSPVHDRLVGKIFELSGVAAGAGCEDPVDAAGND